MNREVRETTPGGDIFAETLSGGNCARSGRGGGGGKRVFGRVNRTCKYPEAGKGLSQQEGSREQEGEARPKSRLQGPGGFWMEPRGVG